MLSMSEICDVVSMIKTYSMIKDMVDTIVIRESCVRSFSIEWESGERHISIYWHSQVNLFFLIHDANIKLIIDVCDEHCEVTCSAILVSSNNIVSSLDLAVTLKASNTKADIYSLALLGDNAKASILGGITIDPGTVKVQWYLTEENLLLGKKIYVKTLPMLDVRSNDVKASHGATISRLDDQKIFYLTAKWISKHQAEQLMIQAYIKKALEYAKIAESEWYIKHIFSLLEGRP